MLLAAGLFPVSAAQASVAAPVAVDVEFTTDESGYYVLDDVGRVHTFGNAAYFGGSPALASDELAVAMSVTPSGLGYWIFTNRGRVIAYGDAGHFGDVSHLSLAGPIIDSAPTPSGLGYYLLGEDGGIFAFGDAVFLGSIPEILPGVQLGGSIVGIAPTSSGEGYWLVGADGGMFSFGDAEFFGSMPAVLPRGTSLAEPMTGLIPQGSGYLLVAADGGVFNFGESAFHGSIPGFQAKPRQPLGGAPAPVVSVAVLRDRTGYIMVQSDGTLFPFGNTTTSGQPALVRFFPGVAPRAGPSVSPAIPADPGDSSNCSDFASQGDAQRWFDAYSPFYGDPAGLDTDGDGVVCEGLDAGSLQPSDFGPGTYRVGLDIAPGTYRARSAGSGCTWSLRVGANIPKSDNPVTSSHTIVTLDASDTDFTTSPECGTWSLDFSPSTASLTADVMPPDAQDLTLVVGIDVSPGVWRVAATGDACEVERLIGFGGTRAISDSRWRSSVLSDPTYIEILPIDAAVHLSGCSLLTSDLTSRRSSPDDPFGSGEYRVGSDISPGVWTSEAQAPGATTDCSWRRLANFAPESEYHRIATGFARAESATVTIAPTDVGFSANAQCGMWTRVG